MIKICHYGELFTALNPSNACDGKILSLYRAYGTRYDFCRFYAVDGNILLAQLDNDFVISDCYGMINAIELRAFLEMNSCRRLLTNTNIKNQLKKSGMKADFIDNYLMEYCGEPVESLPPELETEPDLNKVYEVLKSAFDIEFSQWYTDTSHRVRHGVSKVFLFNDTSAVTALYDIDGTVFLSLVCTRADSRMKGSAKEMLRLVAGHYHYEKKRVILLCKEEKEPFYIKSGFIKTGDFCVIAPRNVV